jgi:hypothetical protein
MTEKAVSHIVRTQRTALESPIWHLKICAELVLGFATLLGANWNRISFYWATFRCRPRNDVSAASRRSDQRLTIGSALSLRSEPAKVFGKDCRQAGRGPRRNVYCRHSPFRFGALLVTQRDQWIYTRGA